MAQYLNKIHINQPFIGGSPVLKLPLGGKIQESRIILDGIVTLVGGAVAPVIGEGALVEIIKRIKLHGTRLDSRYWQDGYLVDCSARSLVNYAIYQRGKKLTDLFGCTLGYGAPGTYYVHTEIPLYFGDPNMKRQKGTSLNLDAYSSLQLTLDLDSSPNLASCLEGWGGVVNLSQLNIMYSDERIYTPGDTDVLVQEDHNLIIMAAQTRLQDQALPSDGTLLQMLLQTEVNSSTVRTLSDGILNEVKITADNLDLEKYAADIRMQMFDDEWVDASYSGTGVQSVTGQYFMDFMDGKSANGLGLSTLAHYFDVENPSGAGNDQIRIFTRRGYRPSSAAQPYSPAAF